MTTKISVANIQPSTLTILGTGGSSSLKINAVTVANSSYIPTGDVGIDPSTTSYVVVQGTGFVAGCQVFLNSTPASAISFVTSSTLNVQLPGLSAGQYDLYVVNPDGTTGVKAIGVGADLVQWVSPANNSTIGGITGSAFSTTLSANSAANVSISYSANSLPTGLSISGNTITGTPTVSGTTSSLLTARSIIGKSAIRVLNFSIASTVVVEYLIVAGGGAGGSVPGGQDHRGGGGGGGGFVTGSSTLTSQQTYTVTVGSGASIVSGSSGGSGSNSSISSVATALGGGGGGMNSNGLNGGSGGGGGASGSPGNFTGGTATQSGSASGGFGFNGGTGGTDSATYRNGGGGGGAGAVGGNANSTNKVDGGAGRSSSITGSSVFYAGGGAGGGSSGVGGSGGGGAQQTAGTVNTGGGGGGSGPYGASGGAGGSGVVIIRYADTNPAATTTGSPTVTVSGGYRIYTFTGSGSFTL